MQRWREVGLASVIPKGHGKSLLRWVWEQGGGISKARAWDGVRARLQRIGQDTVSCQASGMYLIIVMNMIRMMTTIDTERAFSGRQIPC